MFPRFVLFAGFVALLAIAQQTVTVPVVSTIDANGDVHATVSVPSANNWTPVRSEAPVFAAGVWTLAHAPAFGASCSRNGLMQAPVSFPGATPGTVIAADYTLTGRQLLSPFWFAGDLVVCDYEFIPGT